jgi:hypothetical protein
VQGQVGAGLEQPGDLGRCRAHTPRQFSVAQAQRLLAGADASKKCDGQRAALPAGAAIRRAWRLMSGDFGVHGES